MLENKEIEAIKRLKKDFTKDELRQLVLNELKNDQPEETFYDYLEILSESLDEQNVLRNLPTEKVISSNLFHPERTHIIRTSFETRICSKRIKNVDSKLFVEWNDRFRRTSDRREVKAKFNFDLVNDFSYSFTEFSSISDKKASSEDSSPKAA